MSEVTVYKGQQPGVSTVNLTNEMKRRSAMIAANAACKGMGVSVRQTLQRSSALTPPKKD